MPSVFCLNGYQNWSIKIIYGEDGPFLLPAEFFALAYGCIIEVLPVIWSIGLQNGGHYLSNPQANYSCRLGLVVIRGSSEIEAPRNVGFMLKETIKVVSIFKITLPTIERGLGDSHTNKWVTWTGICLMSGEDRLTQRRGVWSASSVTACQSQQPEFIMMYTVSTNFEAQLKVQITDAVKYPSH